MRSTIWHAPGISYEQVRNAADTLVGRGEKPTIQRVRAELGTGSPNTIHRHLKTWRSTQAPVERQAARLSDELAAALAQELERQAAAARAEAESDAIEARAEADEFAATGEQLEEENDQLTAQAETLEAERDRMSGERDSAIAEVDRLRTELDRERSAGEQARQELAEIRNRVQTLTEQRNEERDARKQAEIEAKAAIEDNRNKAVQAQAVAETRTEAAQQQAQEHAQALQEERQARRDDVEESAPARFGRTTRGLQGTACSSPATGSGSPTGRTKSYSSAD